MVRGQALAVAVAALALVFAGRASARAAGPAGSVKLEQTGTSSARLTVQNTGDSTLDGMSVTFPGNTVTAYKLVSGTVEECSPKPPNPSFGCGMALAPGGKLVFEVKTEGTIGTPTVRVSTGSTGVAASAAGSGGSAAGKGADLAVEVLSGTEVLVLANAGEGRFKRSGQTTYKVRVTNHGPAETDARLSISFTAGKVPLRPDVTARGDGCDSHSSGVIQLCGWRVLEPGESRTVDVVMAVPRSASAGGREILYLIASIKASKQILLKAFVDGTAKPDPKANNRDEHSTTVVLK